MEVTDSSSWSQALYFPPEFPFLPQMIPMSGCMQEKEMLESVLVFCKWGT